MDEKQKDTEERAAEDAKKNDDGGDRAAPDDKTRLKELERENDESRGSAEERLHGRYRQRVATATGEPVSTN